MAMDDSITVSVDVTNSGKSDGEEVVQMYIHDVAASTIHPIKELKGFEKIMILPGKTETITFTITKKTLSFYGVDEIFKAEPERLK